MNKLIINLPETAELITAVIQEIKGVLTKYQLTHEMRLQFYGVTYSRTPPTLGLLFQRFLFETDQLPEIRLRQTLLRVESTKLRDIPVSDLARFADYGTTSIVPRKLLAPTEAGNEPALLEFEVGGVVYRKAEGEIESRPDDDLSLLPWTIEINGALFKRSAVQCSAEST